MVPLELSLIIPFYNDSGCPIPFTKQLQKELEGINYELILVDDHSQDSTPKELASLVSKRVKVIYNEKNKDYGGAIMTGLNVAKGKIIGFSCGDGEVSPKDIVMIYRDMGNDSIIKAIRLNRQDGFIRDFISRIFNMWSQIRFGLNIEDINGYPVYFEREIYQNLLNIKTNWLFNIDLLRKFKNKGHKIRGINISHYKRTSGKSKMTFSRILKMVGRYLKYN